MPRHHLPLGLCFCALAAAACIPRPCADPGCVPDRSPRAGTGAGTHATTGFLSSGGNVGITNAQGFIAKRHALAVRERSPEMSRALVAAGLIIPPLAPPIGVAVTQSGGSFAPGLVETRARALDDVSPATLVAHYATVLSASGWKVAPSDALHPDTARVRVETVDGAGHPWDGVLTAARRGGISELTLAMRRRE